MKLSNFINKINRITPILLLIILAIFLLSIVPATFLTPEEAKYAKNYIHVTDIILELELYKDKNGILPDSLIAINDENKIIQLILTEHHVQYKKEGFRDKSNNIWLIILQDKELPDLLFVGNFQKNSMINKEELIK